MSEPICLADAAVAPREDVVGSLRALLERAEAGEVRGIAIAYAPLGGRAAYSFTLGDCDWTRLLAGVSRLQRSLEDNAWTEGEED